MYVGIHANTQIKRTHTHLVIVQWNHQGIYNVAVLIQHFTKFPPSLAVPIIHCEIILL